MMRPGSGTEPGARRDFGPGSGETPVQPGEPGVQRNFGPGGGETLVQPGEPARAQGVSRVIEESVPGKQVTIAHVIASPVPDVYECLGIDPLGAIGILTLTPYETAIIAADVAVKASGVQVGFLDRFTGSVVVAGDVESVETALRAVCDCLERGLGFAVTGITRT